MRRSASGLAALLIGVALFELIQPVAIASLGDLERLTGLLEIVPPAFLSLFNVTPEFLGGSGLKGYLSLGFSHPVYHLLSGATVIWFACRGLAGEMERGSIQIGLSRPMSRLQVYLARVLGVITVTVLVAIAGPAGMIAGIFIGSPAGDVDYLNFIVQGVACALLVACIGGATLLISASASRMGQAVGWAIALLVISYVIDYFADLWSALEPIEPFSVFDYYSPPDAMVSGEVPVMNVAVLLSIAVIGTVLGCLVFARRDLP
jgi:ABC-2 type transport system permease protein